VYNDFHSLASTITVIKFIDFINKINFLFLLSPHVIICAFEYMFMLTGLHSWGYWIILNDDCRSVLWTRHLIWCALTPVWAEILHTICLHNGMPHLNTVFDSTNLTHSGTSRKCCLVFKSTTIPSILCVLWGIFLKLNPTWSLIKRMQPALTQEPDHHPNKQQLCHVALINLWVWANCIQYSVFPYNYAYEYLHVCEKLRSGCKN
jgi:hypothetical protein